jgi:hypothetical protein
LRIVDCELRIERHPDDCRALFSIRNPQFAIRN